MQSTDTDHGKPSLKERLTVIIPSYRRGKPLHRALSSILQQNPVPAVLVVDDGGEPALESDALPENVKLLRLPENQGGAAARNAGVAAVDTPWITFLDDDDEWLPDTASLYDRLLSPDACEGVCFVSALEVYDEGRGEVVGIRTPATREKGEAYFLERYPDGRSPLTKQTFVIPGYIYAESGGFDEALRSRVHSEFSLRLNAISRIEALSNVTYRLHKHGAQQVSKNPALRHRSYLHITRKHRKLFAKHPLGALRWAYHHAQRCWRDGAQIKGGSTMLRAAIRHPSAFIRLALKHLFSSRG